MPVADAPRNHYYEVLGVSTDASEETIRAAYKRLALQWHPDRHQDNKEEAQKMFVEIHESYLALSEYVKRQQRHKDRGSGKDIPHPVPPWGSEAPSSTPSECGTDRPSSPHSERRSKTVKPRKDRDSKADEHKFPPSIHASHSSGSSSKSSHSRADEEYVLVPPLQHILT
ncbi:hypothetical protein EW026_g2150 [Hermanssonia centrifuga]|uniref:J domain-containing protein n=1 Tax=Hermanssonia centrifuga TaxID=98765 RepID=A0A4S4KP81_9APHY|nr:hypothetical protein EW026_g2150 [Hermanssonia centrifuga]